ncbi:MAG: hypothetical protein EP343_24630 [Deltaproteobacteria bacterium]|nr:MAG: hypothetical protein EP343_24630 [Deltaproteobacteria bacterium]
MKWLWVRVCCTAVVAVSLMGSGLAQAKMSTQDLLKIMKTGKKKQKIKAFQELSTRGKEAVPALPSVMKMVRMASTNAEAAMLLRMIGNMKHHARPVLPALVKLAGNAGEQVPREAAYTISKMGMRGRRALVDLLASPSALSKRSALYGLLRFQRTNRYLRFKSSDTYIHRLLRKSLTNYDADVREMTIKMLASTKSRSSRNFIMVLMVKEKKPRVLYAALLALGKLTPQTHGGFKKTLALSLVHPNALVRKGAREACLLQGKSGFAILFAGIKSEKLPDRAKAIQSIGRFGAIGRPAISFLKTLRKHKHANIRKAAKKAIATLKK